MSYKPHLPLAGKYYNNLLSDIAELKTRPPTSSMLAFKYEDPIPFDAFFSIG
jgi:hypothetical protein